MFCFCTHSLTVVHVPVAADFGAFWHRVLVAGYDTTTGGDWTEGKLPTSKLLFNQKLKKYAQVSLCAVQACLTYLEYLLNSVASG
jgi:hypothetical protein